MLTQTFDDLHLFLCEFWSSSYSWPLTSHNSWNPPLIQLQRLALSACSSVRCLPAERLAARGALLWETTPRRRWSSRAQPSEDEFEGKTDQLWYSNEGFSPGSKAGQDQRQTALYAKRDCGSRRGDIKLLYRPAVCAQLTVVRQILHARMS